ncbi:response regulator [Spirosoma daeguense]
MLVFLNSNRFGGTVTIMATYVNDGSQICIVDDSADFRSLLEHLFSQYFSAYSVCFFADGDELLAALPHLSHIPRLILLDRHMPHVDGHQILLRLKEDPIYSKIPVVMMSSAASDKEVNGCYEAGASSFLLKPLDIASLKAMLEKLCWYWLEINQSSTTP